MTVILNLKELEAKAEALDAELRSEISQLLLLHKGGNLSDEETRLLRIRLDALIDSLLAKKQQLCGG